MISANKVKTMMMMMMMMMLLGAEAKCTWLKQQQGPAVSESMFHVMNRKIMEALQNMGNTSSPGELSGFPDRQYNHALQLKEVDKLLFIDDVIADVEQIFNSRKHNGSNWEILSHQLFYQSSQLNQCVKQLNLSPSHNVSKLTKRIKLHLKSMKKTTREQDLDHVTAPLLAHLQRLDLLASSTSS